jgi:sugar phosphate isomerase/epimerase
MKIGAQTYTIREFTTTEDDFARSMEKVAAIGYTCVQISAVSPDITATRISEICKANGLDVVLTHTSPALILNETDKVIENHKIMGAGYVGLGAMPGDYRGGVEGIKKFIADYSVPARKFKEAGLKFMYHNHAFEFEKIEGKLLMDHLVDGFEKDLMGFTLDTYWVQAGCGDPAWWLRKLAGRLDTIHFKDGQILEGKLAMAEVMEGNLNWDAIFEACVPAGAKWAFVEQDNCNGKDPFDCLKTSYNNLTARGYK